MITEDMELEPSPPPLPLGLTLDETIRCLRHALREAERESLAHNLAHDHLVQAVYDVSIEAAKVLREHAWIKKLQTGDVN